MEKQLEDTQAFSLEELESRGSGDREVALSSNLAPPVNAAEAAKLQEEKAAGPDPAVDA